MTNQLDQLSLLPRRRGRPSSGNAMSPSERVRKHRQARSLVTLTVEIPSELLLQFNEFLKFKDVTKNEVIVSLLRNQLLRKR